MTMSKDIFKTCLDMWCSQTRENCFYFLSTPVDKIFCSDWSWKLRVKDTNVPADHTGQNILLVNTVPSTLIPVHWLMAHVLAMLVWALQCHLSCYNQGHDWVSTDRVNPMMWVLGRFGTQCPILPSGGWEKSTRPPKVMGQSPCVLRPQRPPRSAIRVALTTKKTPREQ